MNASHSLPARPEVLTSSTGSTSKASAKILLLPVLAAAAAILLLFPPTRYSFYPQCPIYQFLGILCPGCGTTRALAALLHGHILDALRLNPLTTIMVPLAIFWILFSPRPLKLLQLSPATLWLMFSFVAAFTLVRNL
jgi:hypothetical protein